MTCREVGTGLVLLHLMPLDVVEIYFHESVIFFHSILKRLLWYVV
jgi:hypothetical protein